MTISEVLSDIIGKHSTMGLHQTVHSENRTHIDKVLNFKYTSQKVLCNEPQRLGSTMAHGQTSCNTRENNFYLGNVMAFPPPVMLQNRAVP